MRGLAAACVLSGLWLAGCGGGGGGGGQVVGGAPSAGGAAGDGGPPAAGAGDGAIQQPRPEQPRPEPPRPACDATFGERPTVLEGEPLQATLRCRTGLPLPSDAAIEVLPAGAVWDAAAATLRWTPALDQAAVHSLAVTIPSLAERGAVEVGVVDRFDAKGNVPVADPHRYPDEDGLPVFHVDLPGGGRIPFAWGPATVTYRGRRWEVEIKVRGHTSKRYAKKSFTLRFPETDPFDDPARGFERRKKVLLVSTFDDASQVRNRLAYELWRTLDPEHLAVNHFSAVVFLNGEYHGLYTAVEKVGGQFLSRHGLDGDGNLYQALTHDANFDLVDALGAPKATPHLGYEKEEGPPGWRDLDEWVRFVATADPAAFAAGLRERARAEDYMDWWILTMFLAAGDSAEKNSFHYHDPAGGPWRCLPWDFNWSFGQDWQTLRESPEVPYTYRANRLFARMLDDPALSAALRDRFRAALDGPLRPDAVLPLLDRYGREVAAAARRDEARWRERQEAFFAAEAGRDGFLSHEGEVAYVREWIARRWSYLDRAW